MGVDWICWMRTGDSKKKLKIKMKKIRGWGKKVLLSHTSKML